MNKLTKLPAINPAVLDGAFYFQSLMDEGARAGLLTETEAGKIQTECIRFLAHQITRYTGGDSSSVKVELAQNILQSILYTIGVFLKTMTPEDAVSALKSSPVPALYEKGRRKIEIKRKTARHLHTMVLQSLLRTKNQTYNETLIHGIQGFFKLYDADFSAHEIHITADYPLSNPASGLAGIEFILAYLQAALLENEFCSRFCTDRIENLMYRFHKGYDMLVINIFDQVLASSVGCILAGIEPTTLLVPWDKVMELQSLWLCKTKREMENLIHTAGITLLAKLGLDHKALREYIFMSLPHISEIIYLAIQTLTLDKVFVG